jgi:hypothetical protein
MLERPDPGDFDHIYLRLRASQEARLLLVDGGTERSSHLKDLLLTRREHRLCIQWPVAEIGWAPDQGDTRIMRIEKRYICSLAGCPTNDCLIPRDRSQGTEAPFMVCHVIPNRLAHALWCHVINGKLNLNEVLDIFN